jgi:hypothetical protein
MPDRDASGEHGVIVPEGRRSVTLAFSQFCTTCHFLPARGLTRAYWWRGYTLATTGSHTWNSESTALRR